MLLLYISGQWLLYQSSHPESTIEVIRPTTLATVNDDNANIYIYIYTTYTAYATNTKTQIHKYAFNKQPNLQGVNFFLHYQCNVGKHLLLLGLKTSLLKSKNMSIE